MRTEVEERAIGRQIEVKATFGNEPNQVYLTFFALSGTQFWMRFDRTGIRVLESKQAPSPKDPKWIRADTFFGAKWRGESPILVGFRATVQPSHVDAGKPPSW
jgi:hypothetical protein